MASVTTHDQRSSLASRAVRDVYPVSRLVREARVLLEGSFPLLWVEGEISNLAMPASGHIYFTLKDEAAQVRCAMFRNRNRQLRFTPENGMQVLLRVRVTLYEGRGEFQLVVEHMEEAGSGALQRAYEALKSRLGQEGLFDPAHKKPLPALPRTIGIVSSPDGAAVHDILSVLKRRFPAVDVILYPVPVQGDRAAQQIAQTIRLADSRKECDVLIVGRGGGSLEDLWCFNDEQLARTLFDCALPVISAVGHEIDFTIADFVADVRAPTPSAAAELAVPDARQLLESIRALQQRLAAMMRGRLDAERRHVHHLVRRLPSPERELRLQAQWLVRHSRALDANWRRRWLDRQQKLDYLSARVRHPRAEIDRQAARVASLQRRLERASALYRQQAASRLTLMQQRLARLRPQAWTGQRRQRLEDLAIRINRLIQARVERCRARLAEQVRTLGAVSPLNTLERGYSITTVASSGAVITRAEDVTPGTRVQVRLYRGRLDCEVREISED